MFEYVKQRDGDAQRISRKINGNDVRDAIASDMFRKKYCLFNEHLRWSGVDETSAKDGPNNYLLSKNVHPFLLEDAPGPPFHSVHPLLQKKR